MPVTFGLGMSHAPSMFASADAWVPLYRRMTGGVGQPTGIDDEVARIPEDIDRVRDALQTLQSKLLAAKPDAVIIVGDDQDEVFGPAFRPNLAVFTGSELTGTVSINMLGEDLSANHIKLDCRPDLAALLVAGLVDDGFDPAVIEELNPISRPSAGIGHAFAWSARGLGLATVDLPVIPVFLNTYRPPLPSASRCRELGAAIARIFQRNPARIAVLASGGLSHDPGGARAGWVDEPLDRWVLDQIVSAQSDSLTALFRHDSDTYCGGTGEIRAWIVVAGAMMERRATVVDYIESHLATTGLAFAYWPDVPSADADR